MLDVREEGLVEELCGCECQCVYVNTGYMC